MLSTLVRMGSGWPVPELLCEGMLCPPWVPGWALSRGGWSSRGWPPPPAGRLRAGAGPRGAPPGPWALRGALRPPPPPPLLLRGPLPPPPPPPALRGPLPPPPPPERPPRSPWPPALPARLRSIISDRAAFAAACITSRLGGRPAAP